MQEGSSLAADDKLFPVLPPSHLAWHGVASAVDHLDMFMALPRSGVSHPLAPNTVARTGMLSGAHALWLLDAPTRAGLSARSAASGSPTRSSRAIARA